MPNCVTIDGVVQSTWTYNDALFARLVHYAPDGSRGYFSLSFPGQVVVKETDEQGTAVQRLVRIQRRFHDKLVKSAVVVVNGKLTHRDDQVALLDAVRRCQRGDDLTEEERAALEVFSLKAGPENRAVIEIAVEEVVFL